MGVAADTSGNGDRPGASDTHQIAAQRVATSRGLSAVWRGAIGWASFEAPPSEIVEQTRLRQIATLIQHLPLMAVASIVNASLVTAALWQMSTGLLLGGWLAVIVLTWLVYIARRLRRRKNTGPFRARPRTMRRAVLRAAIGGGTWGAAALLLFPGGAPIHQLIITFVIGGMAAGAAISMSCFPAACLAYILTSVLPLFAAFLLVGDTPSLAMAAMVAVYACGLVVLARNGYRTFIDAITAEHENERLLGRVSATHARLVEAIETVPAGIVFCDSEDRLWVCNSQFKHWMCPGCETQIGPGMSYAEVLEISAGCASEPLEGAVRREWVENRMANHRNPGTAEDELADGRIVRATERRMRDGGTISVLTDISDLKQNESELSANSTLLHAILENMAQGLVAFDSDLAILASNERLGSMLDTPSDMLSVGKNFKEVIARSAKRGDYGPGDIEEVTRDIMNTALGHKGHRFERTMPNQSVLDTTATPLRDGGFVVTYSDVTERKRSEEELKRGRHELNLRVRELEDMQQRMESQSGELRQLAQHLGQARDVANAANKAKSDFLANMSHELRTPLNAILGFSEIMNAQLLGPLGNPQYLEYMEDIHESGAHLLSLINDILDLSKIEAGRMELHETRIDISETVDAAIRIVRERAQSAELLLNCQIETDLPPVFADQRAIKQVLLNLLSNAVKFTEPGGHVEIVAKSDLAGSILISVSDNGAGMSAADIEKVLQPFGQADGSLSRSNNGTGLGLSLVKSMMEVHGGGLVVESELGEGTTATVKLPAERVLSVKNDPAEREAG